MNIFKPSTWRKRKLGMPSPTGKAEYKSPPNNENVFGDPYFPTSRVSVPNTSGDIVTWMKDMSSLVTPSFRTDLIPLIRKLYKVNPDMGIAVQDMFKLANTGHKVEFPHNSAVEARKMREYLNRESKKWAPFTAGIDGLVNKMIVQCLTTGAISFETVPNPDLDGIYTIVFINPEDIRFRREANGAYHPYQKNSHGVLSGNKKEDWIRLNLATYKYISVFNDTDEPYGVPSFLPALDSLKTQSDMRTSFKQVMEIMGLMGFIEAKMAKDQQSPTESDRAYRSRLLRQLRDLKEVTRESLKDGIVTGYLDDHEFKLTSTTANLQNVDKVWGMNQQSVANGLGINGNIIGVQASTSDGAAGTMLSKLISQLKNLQMIVNHALDFIYSNALLLGGYNNKGIKITFFTTTVTDDIKYQQGQEYKIRNLIALFNQGIIDQDQFAYSMGYDEPAEDEPLVDPSESDPNESSAAKRESREKKQDESDRKTRDKNRTNGKRKDNDSKPR